MDLGISAIIIEICLAWDMIQVEKGNPKNIQLKPCGCEIYTVWNIVLIFECDAAQNQTRFITLT